MQAILEDIMCGILYTYKWQCTDTVSIRKSIFVYFPAIGETILHFRELLMAN